MLNLVPGARPDTTHVVGVVWLMTPYAGGAAAVDAAHARMGTRHPKLTYVMVAAQLLAVVCIVTPQPVRVVKAPRNGERAASVSTSMVASGPTSSAPQRPRTLAVYVVAGSRPGKTAVSVCQSSNSMACMASGTLGTYNSATYPSVFPGLGSQDTVAHVEPALYVNPVTVGTSLQITAGGDAVTMLRLPVRVPGLALQTHAKSTTASNTTMTDVFAGTFARRNFNGSAGPGTRVRV